MLFNMDLTRISTQVSIKHCSLCQGDTEYYCYGCQQDLCIQCKKLHVIDLSTKDHEVTSYTEKMKYPPKQVQSSQSQNPKRVISAQSQDPSKQVKRWRSGDSKQVISMRSQDPDNHEPYVIPLNEPRHHKFLPPVQLSSLEHIEIQRRLYSDRIFHLRGETIYYRSVLLEVLRHDLKIGHKTVTFRGQSNVKMRGQELKNMIDDVLAGDLEDRCIIQKTRMTRHMTNLLRYYHRYEQLSETMETRPFKFLRIMTQKHSPRKDHMKTIINLLVNLMKGIRLVPSGIPRQAGDEDLLTLMSSPEIQKSLLMTNDTFCLCEHISCVTPDWVWFSDYLNIILLDTATGETLHRVEPSSIYGIGTHTVNCKGELIYVTQQEIENSETDELIYGDELLYVYKKRENSIITLRKDMETTTTLKGDPDIMWEPLSVYCSPFSGDLLVGYFSDISVTGKVVRYDSTGKITQTINPLDDLYRFPRYITENNNGDVVVSDWFGHSYQAPSCFTVYGGAVVVMSGEGDHRFSYRSPPSSRSRLALAPAGICTDVMSHILVSDEITHTVHMLDRDGKFMLHIYIGQTPYSLSYDVNTHVVWVSSLKDNMLYKYRYINRHLHLAGIE
uniref:Uncharacterized protein LOC111111630 n=1 Tax=Crassostrea virginica TaxID=6565 RepID=A0A8B8BM68_CRAVI|nr:uncharacterized protein LOC111111630 [Crassostrea virginica]XP_022304427.1 uncharacterized protein LOC111111630 [Crassostrea virginica]